MFSIISKSCLFVIVIVVRLENSLRNFATLTKGDVISINYNEKNYELCILETRPKEAVSIIECDMDVDFAPPVGYEEPNYKKESTNKPVYIYHSTNHLNHLDVFVTKIYA